MPQRAPDFRFLPMDRPRAVVWVMRVAQYLLPLAALLAGVLVWLRRAGGSRRAPTKSSSPEVGAR